MIGEARFSLSLDGGKTLVGDDVTDEGLYLLRGDNNDAEDLPVKRYQIEYKTVKTRW